ncbi:DNA-binding protein [Bacteroidia bacterium]|nr:DNA-binding protein [Bacteroidia bacterium]
MEQQLVQIQNKIHELRGQKVMIDRDLAALYGVETRILNQAVRRNIERFAGDDFMFQLTNEEVAEYSRTQIASLNTEQEKLDSSRSQIVILNTEQEELDSSRSQIVTLKKGRGYNMKYQPFAFTELGVAMLSSVLNSPTAIEINRTIMRTFVELRQYLSHPLTDRVTIIEHDFKNFAANIEEAFADYNDINEDNRIQFELINTSLAELQAYKKIINKPRNPIGFFPPPRTAQKEEEENATKESETSKKT